MLTICPSLLFFSALSCPCLFPPSNHHPNPAPSPQKQVLATSTEALQALYDHLTASLGFSEADVQQLLWECPGLMADYREEMLPLVTRMVQSRRDKYTIGGTYVD